MSAAARELKGRVDPQETMERAAALAVRNVDGCQAASISLARGRSLETHAGTSEAVRTADQLQAETGEGPCLDAIHEQATIYVSDLSTDPRWPSWGSQVAERTGLRSVLSCQLFTDEDAVGALNMYSDRTQAFDGDDHAEALALAAHIAVAMSAAQETQGLMASKDTRSLIGQAMGIAMERYELDAEQAWALLTRLSQSMNVRVRDLAADFVATRTLPRPELEDPDERSSPTV